MLTERAVVRPKVMAPLGNTVRLVDGDQAQFFLGQHCRESRHAHALGSDEEKLQIPVEVVAADLSRLFAAQTRVNSADPATERGHLCGLNIDERDQRADDQCGSAARNGRKLIAEALTCARRHHQQNVLTLYGRSTYGLLICAKLGETKGFMKKRCEFDGLGHANKEGEDPARKCRNSIKFLFNLRTTFALSNTGKLPRFRHS